MVLQKVSFNRASMHCSPFIHRSASRAHTHVTYDRRKRVQPGTNYKIERCTHLLNRMQHAPKQHKVAALNGLAQCTMHIAGMRCGNSARPDVEWIRFIGKQIYRCHCNAKPNMRTFKWDDGVAIESSQKRQLWSKSIDSTNSIFVSFKKKRAKCDSPTFD